MARELRFVRRLVMAAACLVLFVPQTHAQERPDPEGAQQTLRATRGPAPAEDTRSQVSDGTGASVAQPPGRLGAIGDSLTDEYFEQGYDYARNWTELLVEERGLTFGPTAVQASQPGGTWGEPRRTGYEDNWARYAATTDDAIAAGQHTGVAAGVLTRGVSHVTVCIGVNDFMPIYGAWDVIYDGTWSQLQIDVWIASRIGKLEEMLDVVQPTGAAILVLDNLDPSPMPLVQSYYADPVRREAVATALGQFGAEIHDMVQRRADRVLVFLDSFALWRAIFGTNLAPRQTLLVGNVPIDLDQCDTAIGGVPTAAFVHDCVHPNTVLQALWANAIITAFNMGYGTQLMPFSEAEMLAAAGIPYGGSDTLEQEIGPLEAFVTVFIFTDSFESGDTSAWSAAAP